MRPARLLPSLAVVFAVALSGCAGDAQGRNTDPDQVDSVEAPALGACRELTPDDVAAASNATRTVKCTDEHSAQTYAVGDLPEELRDTEYDDQNLGEFAYETCTKKLQKFLGADESLALRTVVSWAWFRPSEEAWDEGARWYRCDAIGGGPQSTAYVALPETAEGLLLGRPDDRWMLCATGESVGGSPKVPCSQDHDWRAVTTIKLGEPEDKYPGDRLVEVTSRDYCSDSVGAWLNYPVEYDFGWTSFHEAEWQSGNRRSVCWAQTTE